MSSLKSFNCAVSALKILTFEAVLDRREGGVRILSPASYRVFGPDHDVDTEYSGRVMMLIPSIDSDFRPGPSRHEAI